MADLTPCARQTACNVNHTTSIVLKMQLYRYIRCFTSIRQAHALFFVKVIIDECHVEIMPANHVIMRSIIKHVDCRFSLWLSQAERWSTMGNLYRNCKRFDFLLNLFFRISTSLICSAFIYAGQKLLPDISSFRDKNRSQYIPVYKASKRS
jgi:hypothetical protein